jgi:hypothetical protein
VSNFISRESFEKYVRSWLEGEYYEQHFLSLYGTEADVDYREYLADQEEEYIEKEYGGIRPIHMLLLSGATTMMTECYSGKGHVGAVKEGGYGGPDSGSMEWECQYCGSSGSILLY